MKTLKFKEWETLNEANFFDKVKDWFSANFGGAMSKLQGLLNDYKNLELEFVDEWEEVLIEIDKLELERAQSKNDPAEAKKAERYIQRNNAVLANSKKVHAKKVDHLMKVVKDVISDSIKLQNFWEVNKAKVDAEVAEEMYKKSKELADSSTSKELYDKYKKAVLKAKERDLEFKKNYGDLVSREVKSKEDEKKSSGLNDSSIDRYTSMSISEFTKEISSLTKEQIKKLASSLIKERDSLYVQMDLERDALNNEISNKTGNGETRESAAKRIKEIREKYMGQIRDLRSKITVARNHD